MKSSEIQGWKVLVVGLARSGLAAANFLLDQGCRVTVTDLKSREALAEPLSRLRGPVELTLGEHRDEDFLGAQLIVLSPGVPSGIGPLRRAAQQGVPVWSEVELAYRFLNGPIVGVTGSNGKTTTTALLGELFKDAGRPCAVAGNIGSPLISLASPEEEDDPLPGASAKAGPPGQTSSREDRTFIVELSSFQLENIHRFRCRIAALLNVTPDHLDRYDSFESYRDAKKRIFLNQTEDDCAVLNADDPVVSGLTGLHARPLWFSRRRALRQGVFVDGGSVRIVWEGESRALMPAAEVRLPGAHNLENVLAAAAVGVAARLEPQSMARTFRRFEGVEHRLEFVRSLQGVDYYNDSKATNVESACRAVESFNRPLILILGGLGKGADFSALRPLAAEKAKRLIVLGAAASQIVNALSGSAPLHLADDFQDAVRQAHEEARQGDVVLLSPACASFDMFDNFEHRGRVFKELVRELTPKKVKR